MIDANGATMNLRTFSAPTFAQAMALVKTEMGAEAVILHTRTVQRRRWMGLRRRETVEITAGIGLNVQSRGIRRATGGAAATQPQKTRPQREMPAPQRQSPPAPGKDH